MYSHFHTLQASAMRTIGRLKEIYIEDGVTKGLVVVDGKRRTVTLTLMLHAHVGDEVVIESGFAFPTPSALRRAEVPLAESQE